MRKLNCWEIKKCGREPSGYKASDTGVCPAAVDESSNGTNGGTNAGRICWAVAGTLCREKVQGDFAQKTPSCVICNVFKQVKCEEGIDTFIMLKAEPPYNASSK